MIKVLKCLGDYTAFFHKNESKYAKVFNILFRVLCTELPKQIEVVAYGTLPQLLYKLVPKLAWTYLLLRCIKKT